MSGVLIYFILVIPANFVPFSITEEIERVVAHVMPAQNVTEEIREIMDASRKNLRTV